MILRAKQEGNLLMVELEGQLDFETTLQFKDTCESLLSKPDIQKVIFNMERLKFVGSSGINQFIQVLKVYNTHKTKPRYCKLSSEFEKIFRAYQTSRNPFEIHLDEATALQSFDLPPTPAKRGAKKKIADA